MIFFFYGDDTYRSSEKVKEIQEKFTREVDAAGLNITQLDGAKLSWAELHTALSAPPFLARKRLVIVRNLLLGSKSKKQNPELHTNVLAWLTDAGQTADTVVVLVELGTPDRRSALFRRLSAEQYAQEFVPLAGRELSGWLAAEIKKRGGEAPATVVELLAAKLGNDLWRATSELDKVLAYADGQPVTATMVEQLVDSVFDENIFALTDALSARNRRAASRLLAGQLESGTHELALLSMLARQVRLLLLARTALDAGTPPSRLATLLAIHPYVAQRAAGAARNFSPATLRALYDQLVATDSALKTGADPRTALQLLIVKATT